MNRVYLYGKVISKSDVFSTKDGKEFIKFTLQVKRNRGKKQDFITLVAWNGLSKIVAGLGKEERVFVTGYLNTFKLKNEDTSKVMLEVIVQKIDVISNKERDGQ